MRQSREFVEEGVQSIELAASTVYNRDFKPVDGLVKWFKDEFDHVWVKFTTLDGATGRLDRVWPSDRVVEVRYEKS